MRVERTNNDDVRAIGHLHVRVGARLPAGKADVVQMARQYLASMGDKREELEVALCNYHGPIEPVIKKLIGTEEIQWGRETGPILAQHFMAPGLREKYQEDLLYYFIPKEYDSARPPIGQGNGKGRSGRRTLQERYR